MAEIADTHSYPSEWLKQEDHLGLYSREDITILAGVGVPYVLLSGMVLGKITASGKWVQLAPAAADGSEAAAGILFLDATAPVGTDKRAVAIARFALVSDNGLKWPVGITQPQIATATSQLKALGIVTREGA